MEVMLGETMKLAHMFKMGQSPKRITAKNIMTLIQFSQNFMQGGWIHKDPFQQLPGFDQVSAGKMKNRLNKNLYQYCTMDKQERIEHFKAIMGEKPDLNQMVEQQEKCIDALPLVKLTMTAEVEGEDEIVVGDILTCKLRAEFRDMPKGQKTGYVHSKNYPFLKRDNWFLIITDENFISLAAIEKFTSSDHFFEKEFKERIGRPGKISFTAILANDSYKGLD
jgi:hypothetical protein